MTSGIYTVKVNAIEVPWSYIKYKRHFSIRGQPFTVKVPNLESYTIGHTVQIYRDGVLVMEGELAKGGWKADTSRVQTVYNCFDYRRKLQAQQGIVTAPSEAAAHVRAQLANNDLHEDTFNNYGSISVDYGATTEALYYRHSVIEDVLFVTGWEFQTDPDGGCDFKAQCGTDLSATIRFSRVEGTLLTWVKDYVVDGMQKVEKVTVIGQGVGSYQAYGSDDTGAFAAGDPETTINRKSIPTMAQCVTAAEAVLVDMDNDIKYGKVEVKNVNEGRAFDVFDTVNIVDDLLGIDEDLRVAGMDVEVWADTGESIILEVCNIVHLQTSGEYLIGDISGRLEDDFSRTNQVARVESERTILVVGESEDGYSIVENGASAVTVEKDQFKLSTGATAGDDCYIETPDDQIDFAQEPSVSFRFEINHVDPANGMFAYIGPADDTLTQYIAFLLFTDTLYAVSTDPPAASNIVSILDPVVVDTVYTLEIYSREGLAYFYLDGVLVSTQGTGVTANPIPTAGVIKALYAGVDNGPLNTDVILKVYNYEVKQKW